MIMKNKLNVLGIIVLAVLAVCLMTACGDTPGGGLTTGDPTNPQDPQNPNGGEPNQNHQDTNNPANWPAVAPVADVSIAQLSTTISQDLVNIRIDNIKSELISQARTIGEQYDSFDAYIRGTGSNSANTYAQMDFAYIVKNAQNHMVDGYGTGDAVTVVNGVNNYMGTIKDAMCNLSDNPALLRAYIEAFQKTHSVQQRRHFEDGEQAALYAEIAAIGVTIDQLIGGGIRTFV